jgi:DNA-binding Lrp family transcriptional regulator
MNIQLDQIDFDILGSLQNNARISNKELAARVRLAPSSCLERVRRLSAAGVLRGFHAEVDPGALGHGLQAMITVRLRRHARREVVAFRAHLLALPEVLAIFHVGGSYDFVVHVAVRDSNHLRDLAMDSFTARPEVGQMETHFIFEYTRSMTLPIPPSAHEGDPPGEAGRKPPATPPAPGAAPPGRR